MNGLCVGCGEGVCNRVKGIKGGCSLFEGLNTKFDTFGANGIKKGRVSGCMPYVPLWQ